MKTIILALTGAALAAILSNCTVPATGGTQRGMSSGSSSGADIGSAASGTASGH